MQDVAGWSCAARCGGRRQTQRSSSADLCWPVFYFNAMCRCTTSPHSRLSIQEGVLYLLTEAEMPQMSLQRSTRAAHGQNLGSFALAMSRCVSPYSLFLRYLH